MTEFINMLLKASITAGIAALAVIIIRAAMKKAPKRWAYALWAVVFFRCLCPFSIESSFSIFNAVKNVSESAAAYEQLSEFRIPADSAHRPKAAKKIFSRILPQSRQRTIKLL